MFEALALAFKVVMTAYSAYTAVQGLREGDLLKAAVGAVGAAYGMNSIGNQMASAPATKGVANEAVKAAAPEAAMQASKDAALGLETTADPIQQSLGAATDNMSKVVAPTITDPVQQTLGAAEAVTPGKLNLDMFGNKADLMNPQNLLIDPPQNELSMFESLLKDGKEALSDVTNFAKENKDIASAGLQYLGAAQNRNAMIEQIEKNNKIKERNRLLAMQMPTYRYHYGG